MSILVPSLQKLNFQDTDDETVLPFEDFIKFVRQNLTDRDKNIRVDNIKVELSNKNELRKIAGKIFVTFQGIIVYTASHINDYVICKSSFQDICNILCGKNSTPICSTLELYKIIAKLNISMPSSSTCLDEDILQTLHNDYKSNFNEDEWNQVCRFECQFQRKYSEVFDFEETLKKKVDFFRKLQQVFDVCQNLNTDTSSYIAENQKRKEVSDLLNGEIVKLNNITHTYDGFTKSVREYQEYILTRKCINIIIECINVMCTNHTHGIHVFVALEEEETVSDLQILEDYATIIRSDLHKTHGVTVPEVIFLDKNTVKGYMCKNCTDGSFHKFHLRDDYFSRKLVDRIYYISTFYDDSYADILDPKTIKYKDEVYCTYCFEA
jgi:hypothetical protein